MRKITLIMTLLLALTVAAPGQAQGLSGLWKKAKKMLESTTTTTTTTAKATAAEIALEGGGTMMNPMSDLFEVQLVGLYGKSTSLNYGTVWMVLKIKMLANKQKLSIGSNSGEQAMLVDQDGNSYQLPVGFYDVNVTEGIFVKVPLTKWSYPDVKKTARVAQLASISIGTGYGHRGMLTLKNVPIQWDVNPEE